MLGTRGCRLGIQWPEIYEMQVRAIARAAQAVQQRTGEAPLVEIMHPLVGFREELRRLRELTEAVMAEEAPEIEYLCGTMIELPRAALRADEIAEVADFFSFGTNDLTQTTLGMSRDDAEGKFLTFYLEDGVLERNPFETLDQDGVGDLMRIGVERGRCDEARHQARHLRRARRRAELGRVLPRARPRLRLLLAVPRPARAARRRAGGAQGGHRARVRHAGGVAKYEFLVDGRSRWKATSEDDARAWLREYRDEHVNDDPDAVHVQIRKLSPWSWLTGGTIVDREQLLGASPRSRLTAPPRGPGDRRDRRLRRDALEGAEPLPRHRPAVADEPRRPGRVEPQPRDDRGPRLARLARADAGAVRAAGDDPRGAGRLGRGRGQGRARSEERARLSRLAASAPAEAGDRRQRCVPRRARAHGDARRAGRTLQLSYGTRLPPDRRQPREDTGRRGTITGAALPLAPSNASIIAQGRRFLGTHYLWGGLSAWGFDCSGLIWDLYRAHGLTIPRDADPQMHHGTPVARSALKPGDLLFFGSKNYADHVSIYLGDDQQLEAPDSAHRVRISPVRWTYYIGARRYLTR